MTSRTECGPPSPVSKRVVLPSWVATRKPIAVVRRLNVAAIWATVMVTEWKPRIACSSSTGPSGHGFQRSSAACATSASSIPSASCIKSASVSKVVTIRWSTVSSFSRLLQKPSDPGGTWKETVVTWPLPARCLGQVGQPKKVIAVPGVPR